MTLTNGFKCQIGVSGQLTLGTHYEKYKTVTLIIFIASIRVLL
jgi:hypothetical protein